MMNLVGCLFVDFSLVIHDPLDQEFFLRTDYVLRFCVDCSCYTWMSSHLEW
jgi:hypothetical protein